MKTSARTLAEALAGADVFFGLSVKGAVTKDMVKSMADKPIIFAMANPDPEITAEEVAAVRSDAIMATGRSDYPNQINNILGFPYIFRGALDVRASTINMEMKIAAAHALAELAREDVPDEVAAAYGTRPKYGPEYIIPVPFDPRLISYVPPAIAKAGAGQAPRKRRFGPWMLGAMKWLAKGKALRGTAFDPFGRTEERRMERALIDAFDARVAELCAGLSAEKLAVATSIAAVPLAMRGYGHVKLANVTIARACEAELLHRFDPARYPRPPSAGC